MSEVSEIFAPQHSHTHFDIFSSVKLGRTPQLQLGSKNKQHDSTRCAAQLLDPRRSGSETKQCNVSLFRVFAALCFSAPYFPFGMLWSDIIK